MAAMTIPKRPLPADAAAFQREIVAPDKPVALRGLLQGFRTPDFERRRSLAGRGARLARRANA